jgi:putative transposase
VLDPIIEWRGQPEVIRLDNGPKYISGHFKTRAEIRQVALRYIQPGNPSQNAYVKRYNRTVRHEWLNQHLFESLNHAQETATQWLWTYNTERPNTAIGGVPPREKLNAA